MINTVISKSFCEPELNIKEILRYAGSKAPSEEVTALLDKCLDEIKDKLSYQVCYREFPVSINGEECDFGAFKVQSEGLSGNLKACESVVVFAATVGMEIDRLIGKYSRIAPSKSLFFQAIGAERIETLCDVFCDDLKNSLNRSLMPRFSPGYGDLSLETQKDIFGVLDCQKRIGLFLNGSLLMSPSKSVTAFVGVCDDKCENIINQKCSLCDNVNCTFRGNV